MHPPEYFRTTLLLLAHHAQQHAPSHATHQGGAIFSGSAPLWIAIAVFAIATIFLPSGRRAQI